MFYFLKFRHELSLMNKIRKQVNFREIERNHLHTREGRSRMWVYLDGVVDGLRVAEDIIQGRHK